MKGKKVRKEDHPSYSPAAVRFQDTYEYEKLEMRDITPISFVEEIKKRDKTKSIGWLGSRRELVLNQLYSQIRSTIRIT